MTARTKKKISRKAAPKKTAAKKPAPKKAPAKKSGSRKASSPKPAARKASASRPPVRKSVPKKTSAASAPVAPVRGAKPRKKAARAKAGAKKTRRPTVSAVAQPGIHPELGVKWACFSCDAKFYDLNKPEPVCPRCGTDQRTRPRRKDEPKAPAKRRRARSISPLLDDDETERDADDRADGAAASPDGANGLFDDSEKVELEEDDD